MTASEKVLVESALRAVTPWYEMTLEPPPERKNYMNIPQQEIDICLSCSLPADACDQCNGKGKTKRKYRFGRDKKIDMDKLSALLELRLTNKEMCKILEISEPTLCRLKKRLKGEQE